MRNGVQRRYTQQWERRRSTLSEQPEWRLLSTMMDSPDSIHLVNNVRMGGARSRTQEVAAVQGYEWLRVIGLLKEKDKNLEGS